MKAIAIVLLILSVSQAAKMKNPAFLGEETVLSQVTNMMKTGKIQSDVFDMLDNLTAEITAE